MKLINRGNQQSPIARQACDIALAAHHERYGDYGRSKMKETYTILVEGVKVTVEVVNRKCSYVATAMIGVRKLRNLPAQAN
ncbi:DUF4060 family protein [Salmonella enterica subsp. enterica serovar Abaetetuba]|nr:DUF4060 family protein [Salmonella enterica subsp. enterica serovar Abaetetuba]ECD1969452.1 DUF4060 family protein [Salmonella enterica subsp. enterica serovar Abaetetuba]EJR4303909.1 DUF4060 family protein [Salmonella enterica]EJR4403732.1 DUF4060 family protein [Salmonella enterica]